MKIVNQIQKNADTLVDLYERITQTMKDRDKNEAANKLWKDACDEFHNRYDNLAFPGGLEDGLDKLKQGNAVAIENSICFLEADPYFHRSGYIKEAILRYVKKADISDAQASRLRSVILKIVDTHHARELNDYKRLAIVIADDKFIEDIKNRKSSSDEAVQARAIIILEAIT